MVGYVLRRFGFPWAPMVLAVVLGLLADENLPRAQLVFDDEPWWCPITDHNIGTVLIIILLYTLYGGIFGRKG